MKNAKRMLRRRDVVAQDEIKLIIPVSASGDRRYGIVRLSVGLRENKCVGVGIEPPCTEDFIRKCDEALFAFSVYPNDGQRPFDDTGIDVLESRKGDFKFCRSAFEPMK